MDNSAYRFACALLAAREVDREAADTTRELELANNPGIKAG